MIENLLEVEIEDEFDKLSTMDKGSDEYKATVDGLAKLLDRSIEYDKLRDERDKAKQQTVQFEEEKKDRLIKNILTGAGVVIPAVLTVWGTLKSLKFEETGTVTTIMGRGFINKLLPKK